MGTSKGHDLNHRTHRGMISVGVVHPGVVMSMGAFVLRDPGIGPHELQLHPTIPSIWALVPDLVVLSMINAGRVSDNQRMFVSDSVAVK